MPRSMQKGSASKFPSQKDWLPCCRREVGYLAFAPEQLGDGSNEHGIVVDLFEGLRALGLALRAGHQVDLLGQQLAALGTFLRDSQD